MSETEVLHQVRAALMATGRVSLWRNNAGGELVLPERGPRRFVHYGLGLGSPDLVGFLRGPSARFVGFEVKAPGGRLSKQQRLWHAAAHDGGAFVAVVHSPDEALAALDRALSGGVS